MLKPMDKAAISFQNILYKLTFELLPGSLDKYCNPCKQLSSMSSINIESGH